MQTAVVPFLEMQVIMPTEQQALYDRCINEINAIDESEPDPVIRSERCAGVAGKALLTLKQTVLQKEFNTATEEIHFFKFIKPKFYAQLLYHQYLYGFESRKPVGAGGGLKKYIKKKLKQLNEFFEEHADLYQYLRQRKTYLDQQGFLRANREANITLSHHIIDGDPSFSTALDFEVADIMKNEMLQAYLTNLSKPPENNVTASASQEDDIFWTGTLNGMNQLVRSLIKSGAINNGNIPISKVIAKFEPFFHIDLKNFYRASQENRIKKERSSFLKHLVKVHEQEMDELDENPRY